MQPLIKPATRGGLYAPSVVIAVIALILLITAVARAEDQPKYNFVPNGVTSYEVTTGTKKLLKIHLQSWGPGWKHFSFPGQARVTEDGARTLATTHAIPGTEVPLRLAHRVAPDENAPNTIVLNHQLAAERDSALTLISLTITPEDHAFARLEVQRPNGLRERIGLPLRGRRLTGEAVALRFLTEDEQPVTLAFDSPRRLANEGPAVRVTIAAESIQGDQPPSLTTRVTTPDAVRFYALAEDASQRTDTTNWFAYPVGQAGTPIDLSFLNKDPQGNYIPAGAHGFLQTQGERFVFEDGTAARFWGVNLTAAAALGSPARAEQLAQRLARLGVNLVRLHHLDSWHRPIIDYDHPSGTSQHLNAESMRRLDRLIYELKQRGIYIILDPWVQRTFTKKDNVPNHDKLGSGNFHLHPYIFFDDRMRELHKQYMHKVWSHVNEHTGLAYKDDPAFAMTSIANEALMQRGGNHVTLEPYRTDFIRRYQQWARENDADPTIGERIITQNWPRDHQRFYIHLLRDFYSDMHQFLRDDVGLRIPLNASNWYRWHWELRSQEEMDYMDAHLYYNGDQVGAGGSLGGLWVAHPPHHEGTPFGRIAGAALHGKPLIASEVGQNPPKTYRSAYYPGLAAVAAFQGWDAITPYAYSQSGAPTQRLTGPQGGAYEFESDPATIASLAAAALIYRRGDVQPAQQSVLIHADDDHVFQFHHTDNVGQAYENTGLFNRLIETHRLRVQLGPAPPADIDSDHTITPAQALQQFDSTETEIQSDTGQLWRDWQRGIGTINTPRTQSAYGHLGSHDPLQTADARFAIDTPFATVSLSSLTDTPLRKSDRLLLIAVARAENTGTVYDLVGSRILDAGRAPMIAEPVVGTVTIDTDRAGFRMYPVRVDGSRGDAVDVPVHNGQATFNLQADHETLFYEIDATDSAAADNVDLPHRLRHLAALAETRDQSELAATLLERALDLAAEPRTSRQRVALLQRTGSDDAYHAVLREHVRLDRDDEVARLQLTRHLASADPNRHAETLKNLIGNETTRILPPALRSRLAVDFARLHQETGDTSAALQALANALQLDAANLEAAEMFVVALEKLNAPADRIAGARKLRDRAALPADLAEPSFHAALVRDQLHPTQPALVSFTLTNPTSRTLGVGPGQPLPRDVRLTAVDHDDLPEITLQLTERLHLPPGESLTRTVELEATPWAPLWRRAGREPITLTMTASHVDQHQLRPLHVLAWDNLPEPESPIIKLAKTMTLDDALTWPDHSLDFDADDSQQVWALTFGELPPGTKPHNATPLISNILRAITEPPPR
ncbi:MAG: hypothetical protein WD294_05300 [Phycisphaeraceae bacterium]